MIRISRKAFRLIEILPESYQTPLNDAPKRKYSSMEKFALACILLTCIIPCFGRQSTAPNEKQQQTPPAVQKGGRISGLFYTDYFFKSGGDTVIGGGATQFSLPMVNGANGFLLRRLYVIYDHVFSEQFVGQVILETNDKSFEPGTRHGFFLKMAYVEWKNLLPRIDMSFGLIGTPTWAWGNAERLWGYRSVEKTIADFRSLGGATDFGIAFRGRLDADGALSFYAGVGNGTGQKPDADKYKKYYGMFVLKLFDGFLLEATGDYEPASGDRSTTTMKGLAVYQIPELTLGCEFVRQSQKNVSPGVERIPSGVSFYATAPISSVAGWKAFARYDSYDPDVNLSTGYRESFITAGFDYAANENVHFIPNFWLNAFSQEASTLATKEADIAVRLTVAVTMR